MKYLISILLLIFASDLSLAQTPLRIIMIGAHPDDCDQDGGGTAILFSKLGYAVKFVSVTNGDAGHQSMGGGMLAKRRMAEAKEAGKRYGVEYEVLDNHDGELLPSLEVRLQVIRKIRSGMQISLSRRARMIITPITDIQVYWCKMLPTWWRFQT